MTEPGFAGNPPAFIFDADALIRKRHEQRQAEITNALHRGATAPRLPSSGIDQVLAAVKRGDMESAKAACTTRAERWPVFRFDANLAGQLWPDTAEDFQRTVSMFGSPETWD